MVKESRGETRGEPHKGGRTQDSAAAPTVYCCLFLLYLLTTKARLFQLPRSRDSGQGHPTDGSTHSSKRAEGGLALAGWLPPPQDGKNRGGVSGARRTQCCLKGPPALGGCTG